MSVVGSGVNQIPSNGHLGEVAYLDIPDLKKGEFAVEGGSSANLVAIESDFEVSGTGQIVIPRNGLYAIQANIGKYVQNSSGYVSGSIYLIALSLANSFIISSAGNGGNPGANINLSHTGLLPLSKGDRVFVSFGTTATSSGNIGVNRLKLYEVFSGQF